MHRTASSALTSTGVFRLSRAQCWFLLALAVLTLSAGLGWRYGVIENAAIALVCDAGRGNGLCVARQTTVLLFNYGAFGGIAFLSATFNFWRPSVAVMAIAVLAIALGLTLYNTAVAALACGLVILALARPA